MEDARWESSQRDAIYELYANLQECLNAFTRYVTTRFIERDAESSLVKRENGYIVSRCTLSHR